MEAERQIKIARGAAFFLIFPLILAPGLFLSEKLKEGDSTTWQFILSFMGLWYILTLPLFAFCLVFAWSLKRRKQKTALVLFILLAIWMIILSARVLSTLSLDEPILAGLLPVIIPIVVVVLLLQGVLGLRKSQAVSSPSTTPN